MTLTSIHENSESTTSEMSYRIAGVPTTHVPAIHPIWSEYLASASLASATESMDLWDIGSSPTMIIIWTYLPSVDTRPAPMLTE